jgi:molybdopterin synthase catalytic subunit
MKVKLLFFGPVADAAGSDDGWVDLPDGACVGDALDALRQRLGPQGVLLDRVACAVNLRYAPVEQKLSTGDEVALIPPVSGG